jgi:hypothetical protein
MGKLGKGAIKSPCFAWACVQNHTLSNGPGDRERRHIRALGMQDAKRWDKEKALVYIKFFAETSKTKGKRKCLLKFYIDTNAVFAVRFKTATTNHLA